MYTVGDFGLILQCVSSWQNITNYRYLKLSNECINFKSLNSKLILHVLYSHQFVRKKNVLESLFVFNKSENINKQICHFGQFKSKWKYNQAKVKGGINHYETIFFQTSVFLMLKPLRPSPFVYWQLTIEGLRSNTDQGTFCNLSLRRSQNIVHISIAIPNFKI